MGSFYTATLFPNEQTQAAKDLLKGRNFYICSKTEDYNLISEQKMEDQYTPIILDFVKALSEKSEKPIISYMIHDSDVLWFVIYKGGKQIFILDNSDEYFSDGDFVQKESANIPELFGIDAKKWKETVCKEKFEEATFADEFLIEILKILKLPDWVGGIGYSYIDEDEDFRSELEDFGIKIEKSGSKN